LRLFLNNFWNWLRDVILNCILRRLLWDFRNFNNRRRHISLSFNNNRIGLNITRICCRLWSLFYFRISNFKK
jgi:hypothetical protein